MKKLQKAAMLYIIKDSLPKVRPILVEDKDLYGILVTRYISHLEWCIRWELHGE